MVDPWFSGRAFNNGWSLLDETIKDEEIIGYLKSSGKKIYIWYSHEHSDHLSFKFLKKILSYDLDYKILFHKTKDKRVLNSLINKGFNIFEHNDGKEYVLDDLLSIVTWTYSDYVDSYCLINVNKFFILNINDCVFNNKEFTEDLNAKTKLFTNNIDILFTQFGYANWISNKEEFELRKKKADEKNKRIQIQNQILNPDAIIPFASFIYFCHHDNFFNNDYQNIPYNLRKSSYLRDFQDKIFFMKPNDKFYINKQFKDFLKQTSYESEKFWDNAFKSVKPLDISEKTFTIKEIFSSFKKYKLKTSLSLLFLPQILEVLGFIKPIKVYVSDLEKYIQISWIKSSVLNCDSSDALIFIKSSSLLFTLTNDFGIDCLSINGRFYENEVEGLFLFERFLIFQKLLQRGISILKPRIYLKTILSAIFRRFTDKYLSN